MTRPRLPTAPVLGFLAAMLLLAAAPVAAAPVAADPGHSTIATSPGRPGKTVASRAGTGAPGATGAPAAAQPVRLTAAQLEQQRTFCARLPATPTSARGPLPPLLAAHPKRLALRPRFVHWSAAYGVPADLLEAVAWQESGWQNTVVSRAGAVGIGQLMPETAAFVARDLLGIKLKSTVADDNIRMSARLLRSLLDSTGGNPCRAVAAYYEGLAAVRRVGVLRVSQPYVRSVLALRARFA
jgi:soluble lytic murein transglycosylase-like protein